ncbi:MAG: hypothetical protein AAF357_03025 [Verrucomicrobiota bacterium]
MDGLRGKEGAFSTSDDAEQVASAEALRETGKRGGGDRVGGDQAILSAVNRRGNGSTEVFDDDS